MDLDRAPIPEILGDFGFTQLGGRVYRAAGTSLTLDPHWWVMRRKAPADVDWFARRGPWKLSDPQGLEECCDLPVSALDLDSELVKTMLTWVLECPAEHGAESPGPAGDADRAPELAPSQLTARAGSDLCQGVLLASASQLRVEFKLDPPPADLPTRRREWLTALSLAARRDRMVRVTIHPETGALWASVDLTGCPPIMTDALLTRAAAHLRSLVERMLPVVRVLNNPSVVSRALCSAALSPTAMEKDE